MKNWKKRWQKELDNIVPAMNEELKNEPIPVAEEVKNRPIIREENALPWYKKLFSSPRRIAAFASACGVCVLTLGLSLVFGLQFQKGGDSGAGASMGAVSVQINPEAVFSVDDKGRVSAVAAMNTDADVILSDSARIAAMQGKPVEEAVKAFVDYAARLGYLDLSARDAVRVTSCTSEDTTEIISNCLQSYFCEKGAYIVVVEESVGVTEFAEYIGLGATASVETLAENIQALTVPYFIRYAENQTDKRLEELYYEQVEKTEMEEVFGQILQRNFDKLQKYVADVQALAAQEERIRNHSDNPLHKLGGLVPCDYWILQGTDKEIEYTADFESCMKDMERMLKEYEIEYEKRIISSIDFQMAVEECDALPLDTLKMLMENFDAELFARLFEENSASLIKILKNIGEDVSHLSHLYEAPTDWEDYGAKMQKYVGSRYEVLEEKGKEAYEQDREKIGENDYNSYLQTLLEEYGSMEKYWESIKK
ncbi:MAG: hypothetical protein IJ308_05665 [Clostridia bacterium]|nr:hypothetical protein [Clostridia bacterium]